MTSALDGEVILCHKHAFFPLLRVCLVIAAECSVYEDIINISISGVFIHTLMLTLH